MHFFTLFFLAVLTLHSNDAVHTFVKSKKCQSCHAQIYNEFTSSMHFKSTPQKDPIHRAVWDKHPQNNKQNRYGCGKCHTPAANDLDQMITKGQRSFPDARNETHQEGISCAYCHRIQSVKINKKSNINIISKKEKKYFSASKEKKESPFHAIDNKNEIMQNGTLCIGCHSHKMNKHKLNVCSTNLPDTQDKESCVSCHMPKKDGHAFHGFAGSHNNSEMLQKYVDIALTKNKDDFFVTIKNHSSHALLLHPLRVAVLKVSITRKGKVQNMKNEVFVRVIGHDGKPAMPWKASVTLKDTMIQANEKRSVKYDVKLSKGDKVDVVLGWFLANPKAVKKLGLQNEDVATKFIEFKKESFTLSSNHIRVI